MAQVKFVRGNKITKQASWNSKVTTDSIAFDKDNKEIYLGGDKYSQTKLTELTNDNAALQVGDSLNVAFSKLNNIIIDNEEITAEALNDLNNHKVNTEDLATVATTGSYNDLTDKPNIPVGPMVFKGSLGTGGTITTLPTASSDNTGHTYKVITDGTYANQSAKAGDTFVSDGSTWILIPSGDEPTITLKTLKTNNTTAQTASASETLSGSGTINLHKVSKTGSYNDLLDKPTIPTIPNLSKGDTKGSGNAVTDISVSNHQITLTKGKTFLESFTETDPVYSASAAAGITASDITNWNNKLDSFTETDPTVPAHVKSITQQNITDWNNKQDALTFDSTPTENSTNPVTSGGLYTVITENEKTTSAALNNLNDRKANIADLATVATSGNYNDLINKPIIPTIPDLSKGDTKGSGNAVTDITVNGHTITLTKGTTFASVASPTFTGTPAAPTAASGTNTTQIATTAFVQQELANFDDEIFIPVSTLPTTNIKTNKIYIVPNSLASPENNLYDEYIYKNNAWELIGTSQIDLNGKQDKLISGTNIKTVNDKSLLGSGDVPIIIEGTYHNGVFTSYTYDANTGYAYQIPAAYTGDTRILYVDTISNVIYRYDGSQYVKLYNFNTDSTPTSGSSNFITSGGVYNALYKSGTTAQRPTTNLVIGMQYFDTTLGQPIWWNGTAWVDALGNTPGSRNYVYVENN